jgi:hypothetical protein
METREILLKADKVAVVFERRPQNQSNVNELGRCEGDFALPGARGGHRRQAGWASPGREAGRLPGHRRDQSSRENV